MANRTFKYVDKDRIIPVLEERMKECIELVNLYGDDEYLDGKRSAIQRLHDEIIDGLYDWQPAE